MREKGKWQEDIFSFIRCDGPTSSCNFSIVFLGLVTLDEMKAKREDLVREHEKMLAAQVNQDQKEKYVMSWSRFSCPLKIYAGLKYGLI